LIFSIFLGVIFFLKELVIRFYRFINYIVLLYTVQSGLVMRFDQWSDGSINKPVTHALTGLMTGPVFKTLDEKKRCTKFVTTSPLLFSIIHFLSLWLIIIINLLLQFGFAYRIIVLFFNYYQYSYDFCYRCFCFSVCIVWFSFQC
jgi:hypothetical protein